MSRRRPLHRKLSRNAVYTVAGSVAAASVAATVIAAGPALFSPAHADGRSLGTTTDLALATGRGLQGTAGQPDAAGQAQGPENPALVARKALSERYYMAVRAERRHAAARKAAELAAAQRRQAAGQQPAAATPSGTPQQIAMAMLPSFGWSSSEFGCLNDLWDRESGWNPYAANPASGAYGIPQALPGAKMATAGADWQANPATQIHWGLGYIQSSYGSPCAAWAHETSSGWY